MLEIELIKKLVEAYTMWVTPPYYTNDAQDVIRQAVGLAVDTEWEKEIQEVLEPELKSPSLEQLETAFLRMHYSYTKDNLADLNHDANREFHGFLQQSGRNESERIVGLMESLIQRLGDSVSDKVHRRNMQIADLKKQEKKPDMFKVNMFTRTKISTACSRVNDLKNRLLGLTLPDEPLNPEATAKALDGVKVPLTEALEELRKHAA